MKKMKKKKAVCFPLALLMLALACLAACSGGGAGDPAASDTADAVSVRPSETDAPAPETEPPDPDTVHDLPADLDFEGADFVMYAWSGYRSLANEEIGETLNDAQYDVKRSTEELLNVSITELLGGANVESLKIRDYYFSGDTEIHVSMEYDREAFLHAIEDLYTPLSQTKYVDLTKKYWSPAITERLAIGEYELMALGSFQLEAFTRAGCIFMNLAVAENVGAEVPYDLVKEGKWTFDAIARYSGLAFYDVNGDGKVTPDDSTTFGSSDHRQTTLNFMSGAGVPFMGKDENNLPAITAFGNEKLVNVIEWVKSMFFNPMTSVASAADMDSMITVNMFTHDRQLFLIGTLNDMRGDLREMDSVYAVFPIPKYDEAQENYYARIKDTVFPMLFNFAEDPDMDSAVLEAMSAYAYQNLIPALVETSLQKRYNNDPRSVENIQLVFDSRIIELSDMMLWDEFGDTGLWRLMYQDKAISSWLASIRNKAEGKLEGYIEDIEDYFASLT